MTQVDTYTDAHRERTAVDFATRYRLLHPSSAEAAIVGTDGDRLANVMLARTDLGDAQRIFWTAFADIFANKPGVTLPAPPTPSPADDVPPIKRLSSNPNAPLPTTIPGLLNAEEVAALKPLAEGVSKADAAQALGLLELSEAADGHADFGLTEAETTAARLLRDDQRYRAALRDVGDEVRQSATRLAEMNPTAPKKPEPDTGSIFISNL